jgi:large subunit ribosomal protein L29
MNIKEMREKNVDALLKELQELQRAHFSLRMQHATQQLANTSQLRRTQRDIARVRTVLAQKAAAK